jgi:hypothetical protein
MGETMRRSVLVGFDSRRCSSGRMARRTSVLLASLAAALILCGPFEAGPANAQGLVVVPLPASGPVLSYFKLKVAHGQAASVGAIGLRNPTSRSIVIVLAPVAGRTIDTLGSTYAQASAGLGGPTSWLRLGRRRVTLVAGAAVSVPVAVVAPGGAPAGDYLAGVSVEALDQQARSVSRKGVSIASAVRYVIGVEISLPGARHPNIQFTGASLERQPAALTFLLHARNEGNVILQNAYGSASITSGNRVVARIPLGPGTFVTGTSIAYPVPTPREHPRLGAVYRVRAYLRYAGGTARLDTSVRFGRQAALRQQAYAGPTKGASGLPGWLVAALSALGATLLAAAGGIVLRRRGLRSPVRALEAGLQGARLSGEPLSLLVVTVPQDGKAPGELVAVLLSRLRHADRLSRLDDKRFLVVAPDTDASAAQAIADDLHRQLERVFPDSNELAIDVQQAPCDVSAGALFDRLHRETRVPALIG